MPDCHTDGSVCSGFFVDTSHCDSQTPADPNRAILAIHETYPTPITYGNVKKPPQNQVLYGGTILTPSPMSYTSPTGASALAAASCGKELKTICGLQQKIFDNTPNGLSFKWMDSDTWFVYVWESGANAGVIDTPCYWLIQEQQTSSSTATGGTNPPGGTSTTSEAGGAACIECTSFSCTPNKMTCSYTTESGDETGDPDCPYPTIYGIGTDSKKLVFKYNALSTEVPTGVTKINFVYSGQGQNIDVLAYDGTSTGSLDPIYVNFNPWFASETNVDQFYVYEDTVVETITAQGLRVKIGIKPTINFDVDPLVITGTTFEILEVLAPGQGYSLNQTFPLTYVHSHPDSTTTTFNFSIKITGLGVVNTVGAPPGFDLLREGDTINGHLITETAHTDTENFAYHVVYLNGSGPAFTKNTQYTSSRNHVITAVAGYGIKDRCALIGLYEFTNKSIQYTTLSVNNDAPNIYSVIKDPKITVTVSNGQISSTVITDGGEGWNTAGVGVPIMFVTPPDTKTGRQAKVEGTFSNGVLTGLRIIDPGTGYSSSNPPIIGIRNRYKKEEKVTNTGQTDEEAAITTQLDKITTGPAKQYWPEFEAGFKTTDGKAALDRVKDSYAEKKVTSEVDNGILLVDQNRNRKLQINQRLFSEDKVKKLKKNFDKMDDSVLNNFTNPSSAEVEFSKSYDTASATTNAAIDSHMAAITQEKIPEFKTYKEVKVETTQRRFLDMPKASEKTKYLITQYRADRRQTTQIKIKISCTPLETGCGHITCSPPGLPAPSSSTTQSTQNGVTTSSTISFSYLLTGLHGTGCQAWTAEGSMLVYNNLTTAMEIYSAAVKAYGNPFDV